MSTEAIIPSPQTQLSAPTSGRQLPADVKVAFADEAEERQARERLSIIQPLLDFVGNREGKTRDQLSLGLQLYLEDGRPVRSEATMREYLAQLHQVNPSTLWRWVTRYREGGIVALADSDRRDKGKSRWFERYPKAKAVAAALYLDQRKLSVTGIHRLLVEQPHCFDVPVNDLPSYSTVRAYLETTRELTPAMRILAREGLRAYENRVSPFVARAYVDVSANQIWCSDGKICDVEVINDCFPELQYGAPLRLRFTGIECFRSRKLVGWSFSPVESSVSIATAMRAPLVQFGPPEIFYVDNGLAFRKIGGGAERANAPADAAPADLEHEELGLLARLGIKAQYCLPYHGQSKPIERVWRTMQQQFEIHFSTYTGGKPELRPDATAVEMARTRKLLKMGPEFVRQYSNHPPATVFMRLCAAWIDQYNRTPHSGEGMNGATPDDVFAAERAPQPDSEWIPRPPLTLAEVAMSLRERKSRKVHECAIELHKRRYIGVDDLAATVLHDLAEQDVIIAYDPNDTEMIAVLDLRGALKCWARPEMKLPQSAAAGPAVSAIVAQRRRMRNRTLDQIGAVQRLASDAGVQSPLEALAEQAKLLPFAVGDHMARRLAPRADEAAVAPPSAADIAESVLAMEDE